MKDPVAQIKAWLFPSLMTLLAGIIWNDVQEIKADVKALMAQSNIDKTRIDNLERVIFQGRSSSNVPSRRNNDDDSVMFMAIIPNNKEIDQAQTKKKKA
jgi:hypothetical protein